MAKKLNTKYEKTQLQRRGRKKKDMQVGSPFAKRGLTMYFHQWVIDAVQKLVNGGEFDTYSAAYEEATIGYFQIKKPKIKENEKKWQK